MEWLRRFAHDLLLTPRDLLRFWGLDVEPLSPAHGVDLAPEALKRLALLTRTPAETYMAGLLRRYDGTALDLSDLDFTKPASLRRIAAREWADFRGSSYCPNCLKEGSTWPVSWRLSLVVACLRHGCLLLDRCQACNGRVRHVAAEQVSPLLLNGDPRRCGFRVGGTERCAFLLESATTTAAAPPLLALQKLILAAADGTSQSLGGHNLTSSEWFSLIKLLGGLSLVANSSSNRPANNQLTTRPESSEATIEMLTRLEPVLGATSENEARMASRQCFGSLSQTQLESWRRLTSRVIAPAVLYRVMPDYWPRRIRHSDFSALRSKQTAPARWIPAMVSAEAYELFVQHLPRTAEVTGRTFVAMAAYKHSTGASWAEAGAALGLDARRSANVEHWGVARLLEPLEFWLKIQRLEAGLAAKKIPYAERRESLADFIEVSVDLWRELHATHQLGAGKRRREFAAAWAWAEFTMGDYRQSPAMSAMRGSSTSNREIFRRFNKWLPGSLAADLLTAIEKGRR